jgi:hypothetical protein
VGVKWTLNRGFTSSQSRTFLCLGGVVVHHQVQLKRLAVLVDRVAVGPFDVLEEGQELLAVAKPAGAMAGPSCAQRTTASPPRLGAC